MRVLKSKTMQAIGWMVSAAAVSAAPLDMTIKGENRDKIQIERVVPPPEVALKNVIPFSRIGQTDWIMSEEIGYLDEERQVAMMDVRSPKTYRPSMIEFPKPPLGSRLPSNQMNWFFA